MVMNLKRLATLFCLFFNRLEDKKAHRTVFGLMRLAFERILSRQQKDFTVLEMAA